MGTYVYFIEFAYSDNIGHGFQNAEIERNAPIYGLEDILSAQKHLLTKFPDYKDIVVLGCTLLRTK